MTLYPLSTVGHQLKVVDTSADVARLEIVANHKILLNNGGEDLEGVFGEMFSRMVSSMIGAN